MDDSFMGSKNASDDDWETQADSGIFDEKLKAYNKRQQEFQTKVAIKKRENVGCRLFDPVTNSFEAPITILKKDNDVQYYDHRESSESLMSAPSLQERQEEYRKARMRIMGSAHDGEFTVKKPPSNGNRNCGQDNNQHHSSHRTHKRSNKKK